MRCLILLVLLAFSDTCRSNHIEKDSLSDSYKRRLTIAGISTSALYSGSMYLLYQTWYKDYSTSKFHLFNDLNEWKGMDKVGHVTTSLFIAQWLQSVQEIGGLTDKNINLRSVLVPMAFMTTIEVFDGFSNGWGFSFSDLAANTIGLGAFYAQNMLFTDQRFLLKYSFNASPYARFRPNLLGQSYAEQMLKDYNAQTYWLTYPISSLWPVKSNQIPKWLSLSVGYGVDGLLGAESNKWMVDQQKVDFSTIPRSREWYLSVDIDLKKIPIKGKAWQLFSSAIRWVKLPAPALYYNRNAGFKALPFHW